MTGINKLRLGVAMKIVKGKEYFVDDQSYKTCSIDQYVHDAALIWTKDVQRPVFDVWCHVLDHASKLGEALRRELYDDAGHEVGRVAVWLISFVAKLQDESKKGHDRLFNITTPLSEMIWNKYPNCCHTCYGHHIVLPRHRGKSVPDWAGELQRCDCMLRLADVEARSEKLTDEQKEWIRTERREYARQTMPTDRAVFSLDGLEEMFYGIFQPAIFALSVESIGFHFLEEIGEISQAMTGLYSFKDKYEAKQELYEARKLDLEGEIADAFSWLFAVSNKLREIFQLADRAWDRLYPDHRVPAQPRYGEAMWVSERIWAEYQASEGVFGCRDCHRPKCECDIYLVTSPPRRKSMLGS